MTYNIRGTKGMDNRRSAKRIADVIRESGAQIVCLQEMHQRLPYSRMVDQPKVLARSLGMNVTFGINLKMGIGNYGNAVLTNSEIVRTQNHALTSKGETRGALEVGLMTPDGPLTVFCTHFGLNSGERATQGKELAAWVDAVPKPVIVCGDFNDIPTSYTFSTIKGKDLVDGFREAGSWLGGTYRGMGGLLRIDYILHSKEFKCIDYSNPNIDLSDHRPVMSKLVFRN